MFVFAQVSSMKINRLAGTFLVLLPQTSSARDIGAILFAGVQAFF
jgi:hypothetical protein